jgi:Ca2+-binding EF-hand superfamily protein
METQMKTFTRSLIAASLLAVSSLAFADLTPADLARNVTFYDVNKDGKISRTEWMKMAAERLDKMANKDGMVDSKKAMAFLVELTKGDFNTPAGAPMMSKADAMKKAEAMFTKMADKDGMMDAKQFQAFLKELMKTGG